MNLNTNDDIMEDIRSAMTVDTDEPEEIIDEPLAEPEPAQEKPDRARDESGRFAKKEEQPKPEGEPAPEIPEQNPAEQVVSKPKFDAPISMPAHVKAKWAEMPAEVQEYLAGRESDIHRMMTAQDGDLRVGRDMKELINPYMPMFQHAGIAPKEMIGDLLNKTYVLNTGTPQQKLALIHQIAGQFGVDLNQQVDPNQQAIHSFQSELQSLKQQLNPQAIKNQLQNEMLMDKVKSEIAAFESNPANAHYAKVKPIMGSLLQAGKAKDLQDAYDQACWADPEIRSTLQKAEADRLKAEADRQAEKRRLENQAKRNAGASVNGSPALAAPTPKAPTDSIADDIRAAMRESSGAI